MCFFLFRTSRVKAQGVCKVLIKFWLDLYCTRQLKSLRLVILVCSPVKCQNIYHVASFRSFCTQTPTHTHTHTHTHGHSIANWSVCNRDSITAYVSYVPKLFHYTCIEQNGMVVTTANICGSKPALVFIASFNETFNANKQTNKTNKRANKHIYTLLIKICSYEFVSIDVRN